MLLNVLRLVGWPQRRPVLVSSVCILKERGACAFCCCPQRSINVILIRLGDGGGHILYAFTNFLSLVLTTATSRVLKFTTTVLSTSPYTDFLPFLSFASCMKLWYQVHTCLGMVSPFGELTP